MLTRPIFVASSPNTEGSDVRIALTTLLNPRQWYNRNLTTNFTSNFAQAQGTVAEGYYALDSARSALYVYLTALRATSPDTAAPEVILPAFTCLVIVNAVIWAGCKPVYIDIDPKTLNLDPTQLESKITDNTIAIIAQHTFGNPCDLQAINKILGKRKIKVIEDCAHALGGDYQGQKLGTVGDAAIFTFGIEKVISGVRGGLLYCKDAKVMVEIDKLYTTLPRFPRRQLIVALLNPIFWSIAIPTYKLGLGKYTLGRIMVLLGHKLGILGNMIESVEKQGLKPRWMPAQMAPGLATLVNHQLHKLEKLNKHRFTIAKVYQSILGGDAVEESQVYLRYPLILKDSQSLPKLWSAAKSVGVTLGDWYATPLALVTSAGFSAAYTKTPSREEFIQFDYELGSCPVTEDICSRIINLPTSINVSSKRAERLAKVIQALL